MPRLGEFEFPDATLDEMLAMSKHIAKELDRKDVTKKELAALLGQEGARKASVEPAIAELAKLGLLDVKEDRISTTKLARRLAGRPNPTAYVMSLVVVCRSVPLFKLILENTLQYGVARNKGDLFVLVARLTSAKRADLDAHIDGLWDQYRAFLTEVRSVLATPGRPVRVELDVDASKNLRMRQSR